MWLCRWASSSFPASPQYGCGCVLAHIQGWSSSLEMLPHPRTSLVCLIRLGTTQCGQADYQGKPLGAGSPVVATLGNVSCSALSLALYGGYRPWEFLLGCVLLHLVFLLQGTSFFL